MSEAVTDVIVARSREVERLSTMVFWSVVAHVGVVALALALPAPRAERPRTVMTISLGGAVGPRTGGLTQIGGRAVQAPPPVEPVRRAETPPAPVPPKMTLPDPKARKPPAARPKQAPPDAAAKTPATGEQPREGSSRVETGARGQGFGLSSAGGGAGGVTLDVADFCCPEFLEEMVRLIRRNWNENQGQTGSTMTKFTILRDGTIEAVQVERSSGFVVLDDAATRALRLTARLSPLPAGYPYPTLPVHLRFDYSR